MSTELSTIGAPSATGLSLFDSGAFEKMAMIADTMANSSLIPESLRGVRKGQSFTPFAKEEIAANCFRIVEQSSRWGFSPFAVMDGASIVHGKLMWEGKIVSAALSVTTGVNLNYDYSGDGTQRKVVVSGTLPGEDETRSVEGTVQDWKTDQWKGSAFDQRLAYRGAREWARRHCPAAILGIYARDEFDESAMRSATGRVVEDDKQPADANPYGKIADKQPAEKEPATETKPPEGKQTKERHIDIVELIDVSDAKKSGKKTWWTAQVKTSGGNAVEMNTFSSSMEERLAGRIGDTIKVTFTQTPKGGFALEDFEEAPAPVAEGGMV